MVSNNHCKCSRKTDQWMEGILPSCSVPSKKKKKASLLFVALSTSNKDGDISIAYIHSIWNSRITRNEVEHCKWGKFVPVCETHKFCDTTTSAICLGLIATTWASPADCQQWPLDSKQNEQLGMSPCFNTQVQDFLSWKWYLLHNKYDIINNLFCLTKSHNLKI